MLVANHDCSLRPWSREPAYSKFLEFLEPVSPLLTRSLEYGLVRGRLGRSLNCIATSGRLARLV